jgi:hypothetical protein
MPSINGDAYDRALWFFEVWSHYGGPVRFLYYQLRRHRQVTSYTSLVEAATLARTLGLVDLEAYPPRPWDVNQEAAPDA